MLALSFGRAFIFVLVIDADGGSLWSPLLNLSRFARRAFARRDCIAITGSTWSVVVCALVGG